MMVRTYLGHAVTFYHKDAGYLYAIDGVQDTRHRPSLRAAWKAAKTAIKGGAK